MSGDDHIAIDPSMIPSVSEVEQLLPSIIQAMVEENSNQQQQHPVGDGSAGVVVSAPVGGDVVAAAPPPPPPLQPPIIPEQKRIDKDESRLNLLEHIEKMQDQVESLLGKAEGHLSILEAEDEVDVPQFDLDKMSGRMKAIVAALAHDLSTARKLLAAVCSAVERTLFDK